MTAKARASSALQEVELRLESHDRVAPQGALRRAAQPHLRAEGPGVPPLTLRSVFQK